MAGRPWLRDAVLECLTEMGPQTTGELAEYLERSKKVIEGCLRDARRLGLFHIHAWRRNNSANEGAQSGLPSPVWAAGPGVDAPRPRPKTPKERDAEYRERRRPLIRARNRARRTGRTADAPFVIMIQQLKG